MTLRAAASPAGHGALVTASRSALPLPLRAAPVHVRHHGHQIDGRDAAGGGDSDSRSLQLFPQP